MRILNQPMSPLLAADIIQSDMDAVLDSLENTDQLRESTIYITGATGMIASYLTFFFIYLNEKQDHRIDIYANARSPKKLIKRFGAYTEEPYFHFVQSDINDPLSQGFHADYIIHAASLASPQYYGSNPVETMLPNSIGTWHLLETARHSPPKCFLFFSSSAVYGEPIGDTPLTESSPTLLDFTRQGNFYGVSKRYGEALGLAYWNEYDVPFKAARIFHSYGPTMDIYHDKRLFSEFAKNIIERRDLEIKSDGSAIRSFCYLSDTITGLLLILLHGENGQSYNVGNPWQTYTVLDLAAKLADAFHDRGISFHLQDTMQSGLGYLAIPKKHISPFSIDKLEQLGFTPSISVEEGFRKTVAVLETIQRTQD